MTRQESPSPGGSGTMTRSPEVKMLPGCEGRGCGIPRPRFSALAAKVTPTIRGGSNTAARKRPIHSKTGNRLLIYANDCANRDESVNVQRDLFLSHRHRKRQIS